MYCSKCGTLAADDAAFCSKCGTRIGAQIPEQARLALSGPPGVSLPRSPWRSPWLYLVGALLIGTYASDFFPALSGQAPNPVAGWGSLLWSGLFFYLWWKRVGRKGWHGFLIGAGVGILFFSLAAFVAGYMRAAAAS